MVYNDYDDIDDEHLTNKQIKLKYHNRHILLVMKLKDVDYRIYGRTLKRLCNNLDEVDFKMTPQKLSHIFRKYGNHYKDENVEYLGFFLGDWKLHIYDTRIKEKQPQYWNDLTSDFTKLYPILSRQYIYR
jgi:hypothetical protein